MWLLSQFRVPQPTCFFKSGWLVFLLLVTNIRREWYWYCLMWNVIELQRLACSTGATSAKPQGSKVAKIEMWQSPFSWRLLTPEVISNFHNNQSMKTSGFLWWIFFRSFTPSLLSTLACYTSKLQLVQMKESQNCEIRRSSGSGSGVQLSAITISSLIEQETWYSPVWFSHK